MDWQTEQPRGLFGTTHWSLVARAADVDPGVKRQALAELLTQYLPPLRCHLVYKMQLTVEQADEAIQAFLVSKVLEKGIIERASRERGRFRNFLLSALERFVKNRLRDERAEKRGGGGVSRLDDDFDTPASGAAPDAGFDAAWAREILRQAVDRTRAQCAVASRPEMWAVFEARILLPATEGVAPLEYGALVDRFGFATPREASNVLTTAKRMFVRCLRSVIAEYADDDSEVESELRDLYAALAGRGG
jgi:RNA polymerase sigma-70 factor (ECF subfamily)